MAITALPTPPTRSDPTNFAERGDTFLAALPTFVDEANALAAALNLNSTTDSSSSSVLIGTGAKTFTVSTGKSFQPGMYLVIADASAPSTNSMWGQVASYSGATLAVQVIAVRGAGTLSSWLISQSAPGGAQAGANGDITSLSALSSVPSVVTSAINAHGFKASGFSTYTANQALPTTDIGKAVYFGGTTPAQTLTLPAPTVAGNSILLVNLSAVPVSIARTGTPTGFFGFDQTGAASFSLLPGCSVMATWDGGSYWFLTLGYKYIKSMLRLTQSNGYGTTATSVRRWTNTVANVGIDITYADSAANGGTFTINTPGVYSISYTDNFTFASDMAITLNSTLLTALPSNLSEVLSEGTTPTNSTRATISTTVYLDAGSVIRAQTAGAPAGSTRSWFSISRVA